MKKNIDITVPAAEAAFPIEKKKNGFWNNTTYNEINGIIKAIKYLENREILLTRTIKKIIHQKVRFLGNVLASLTRFGLSLMKNVATPLAKSVLTPLGLMAAASATDAVKKKIQKLGMTELIIPSKEMKYIIKIVKSLEKSGSLIKGVVKQFKMKNGYLSILLDTLHASLLGNVLADKGVI